MQQSLTRLILESIQLIVEPFVSSLHIFISIASILFIATIISVGIARLHLIQQVIHNLVGHLVSAREVDMQNILRNMLPRLPDSLTQSAEATHNRSLVQHTLGILSGLRGLLAQTLGTTPATVVRQHLIGNLIIRLELGIFLLHLLPNRFALLHQLQHVLPLLRVRLPQCLCPQVGILMDRCLTRRYTRVNVYLATNSITVSITVQRAEETHLVLYLQILVVEDNIAVSILTPVIVKAHHTCLGK